MCAKQLSYTRCLRAHLGIKWESSAWSQKWSTTHLSSEEEEELVIFLSRVAQIGHGRTRREVITIVDRILSSRGNTRTVTPGWWTSLLEHPNLVLRTPATLSLARASASDCDIIDN